MILRWQLLKNDITELARRKFSHHDVIEEDAPCVAAIDSIKIAKFIAKKVQFVLTHQNATIPLVVGVN